MLGNAVGHTGEAEHITSRSGYNWTPFLAAPPRDEIVNRIVGTPFGPDGWLARAGKPVDLAGHNKYWHVSQACRTVSKYTRHTAGTIPYLAVAPHGWVHWSGVDAQLKAVPNGTSPNTKYRPAWSQAAGAECMHERIMMNHGRLMERTVGQNRRSMVQPKNDFRFSATIQTDGLLPSAPHMTSQLTSGFPLP